MLALILCEEPDETAILGLVAQRAGATVQSVARPEAAARAITRDHPELVVAALRTGALADTVRAIRRDSDAPLIVISPSRDEDTLCRLYETGADRVFTRPYSTRLMIMEMRALMRRSVGSTLQALPSLTVGSVSLNPSLRTVTVGSREACRLTPLEYRLLYTLMIHPGQTIPTDILVERVWGYDGEGSVEAARGLVSRLRAKIEADPANPVLVQTVPGIGYSLSAT
jgi:two-component system response regulator RegX3